MSATAYLGPFPILSHRTVAEWREPVPDPGFHRAGVRRIREGRDYFEPHHEGASA